MITQAHAQKLKDLGAGLVSAVKTVQIRTLIGSGDLQLSPFDETNLAEIASEDSLGERLIVRRIPHLAAERARRRAELLAATEAELGEVEGTVDSPRGRLRGADAGEIGERVGRVVNEYRVAKHFELTITDGSFSCERKREQIETEAALDGLYVLRTTCPPEQNCQARRSSGSTSN